MYFRNSYRGQGLNIGMILIPVLCKHSYIETNQ